MNKIILLFCALCVMFFSSCKTEEQLGNPLCEYTIYPKPEISIKDTIAELKLSMSAEVTVEDLNYACPKIYSCAVQGGDNTWVEINCYGLTVDQWDANVDTGTGGPACAGTSYFALEVLDSINPLIPWAAVSIGKKDWADNTGHVMCIVGYKVGNDTVYSLRDFMFNYRLVYRATGKDVDFRDVDAMAQARTLDDLTMVTKNTIPTWYLSQHECIEMNHPTYDGSTFVSIHHSGRIGHPYLINAARTIEQYSKFFVGDGKNFKEIYGPIVADWGYSDIDMSKPENLPYIFAAVRGIYKRNGEYLVNSEVLHSEVDKAVAKKIAVYKK